MSISVPTLRRVWIAVLFLLIGALVAHWWNRSQRPGELVSIRSTPLGVMGTRAQVIAVVRSHDRARGDEILGAAEAELRRLEAVFSTWIEASEISRLNAAPVGEEIALSAEFFELLDWSHELYRRTEGVFDITAGALIDQWKLGESRNRKPGSEELASARLASSWDDFLLHPIERTATRLRQTAALDVDGVAKGFAIDLAVDAAMKAGAVGAMVEVGGDLRAVGVPPNGATWPIAIRSPFSEGAFGAVDLDVGAVCTSGSYARPVVIGDEQFSHIIDPRTGQPAAMTASVTVVASEASTADAWATALSILGEPGLGLITDQPNVEALVIIGSADEPRAIATRGFPGFVANDDTTVQRLP